MKSVYAAQHNLPDDTGLTVRSFPSFGEQSPCWAEQLLTLLVTRKCECFGGELESHNQDARLFIITVRCPDFS